MTTEQLTTEQRTTEKRTPLHDEHLALGAALTPFAGWQMPLRYSSELAEHLAVRSAAGLFDLSHMGEIRVSGAEAGAALDAALVSHLSALPVGRAKYTLMCAPDGGIVDDLIVYRTEDAGYLVVANASNAQTVSAELRARAASFAAEVTDESAQTALIAVQGPRALDIVTSVTAPGEIETVAALRYYAARPATVADVATLVARTGYTGEDGFELFVDAAAAPQLWQRLMAAGQPFGLAPAGLAARDSLRLEAGMPLYGAELDRTTTPYDAGLGRVVQLDKTGADGVPVEFVGRAALAAAADAEPARVLVGLAGSGRRAPRNGYAVLRADSDEEVGRVTSGAPSPTLGCPIAMAYVSPEAAAPDTPLSVDVRGRPELVRVVALPFYRRPSRTT